MVVKRFRRRSLTRLPLADSQDSSVPAVAQPTLHDPATFVQDAALHVCPPQPGPACLLPLAVKSRPRINQPERDLQAPQPLRPPRFAPVRPFLRWGSQSPKLPSSTPLGGLPPPGLPGPSRLGPYQPASFSGLPPPLSRPTPRSLVWQPPASASASPCQLHCPAAPQPRLQQPSHKAPSLCVLSLPPPPNSPHHVKNAGGLEARRP